MKKLVVILISLVLAVSLILPALAADDTKVNVYDKGQIKSIVFAIGVNQYFINGQTPGITMDAAPYIDSDRTFVPVRFLGNALGVEDKNITWDDSQGRAALQAGSTRAELTIGVKQIITNGQANDIDIAPQLQPPGRTFLPARFVCEALGYEVDWQNDKYVLVWPKGQPKPDIEQLKKQIGQKANTNESNGYNIPKTTELKVDPCKEILYGVEIDVLVIVTKPYKFNGTLEEYLGNQYQDLTTILSSKFDSKSVDEVIAYVKQKQNWKEHLPLQKWAINGYSIEVASDSGDDGIQVLVRK